MQWDPEIESPASIAIIGGGHVAIEAALYARFLGYHVDLFESWRLLGKLLAANEPHGFSWRDATSSLGRAALEAQGVAVAPFLRDEVPDLATWIEEYLLPLARTDLIHDSIHIHSPVRSITRLRSGIAMPEMNEEALGDRADDEFRLMIDGRHRGMWLARADIIIDCSGLSSTLLGLGIGGGLACGEERSREQRQAYQSQMAEGWPSAWDGFRVVVSGHSLEAIRAVQLLSSTMPSSETTRLIWQCDHLPETATAEHQTYWAQTRAMVESATNQSVLEAIGLERMEQRETGEWDLLVAINDESTLDLACDVVMGFPSPVPDWRFTPGLASAGYLLPRRELHRTMVEEPVGPELQVTDDWSGWRFATAEPNYYVMGSKRYWPAAMPDLVASRRDIRDLFALIGARRNLDLYRQFA